MDEEIKKLLEQNLEMTKEIYAMTRKIKGYITFQKFISVIYLLLIVVPIVLSIIYLPPLLKGVFDQYKDVLGIQSGSNNSISSLLNGSAGNLNLDNVDINKLPAQVKGLLNNMRSAGFNKKVWLALKLIPRGRVTTYKELAKYLGKPKAARSVGNACGKNPDAPRVPCHRVVRSDGRLGGYGN